MGSLPVIPDVFKTTLVWTSSSAQRNATNTLYFRDKVGTQTVNDLASDLDASVTQSMWDIVGGTSTRVARIEYKELLDPEPAPTVVTTVGVKYGSGSTADPILQGACVVSLRTALAGKSFRGRIFLPFVAESNQTAGVLTAANVTTMQNAWTAFLAAMNTAGWAMCVVTPTLGVSGGSTDVTSITVRDLLKTQRRRARR